MAKLSTSAWILHDLGMAAGFGGTLFGKAALDPAAKKIGSQEERFKVLDSAWGRFRVLDAVALGMMAATWLAGRSAFSGRRLGSDLRTLVLAKDILIGGALVTGLASLVGGAVMHSRQRRSEALQTAPGTSRDVLAAERFLATIGPINAALVAGVIAVNAALAQQAGKSSRWGLISRLLP